MDSDSVSVWRWKEGVAAGLGQASTYSLLVPTCSSPPLQVLFSMFPPNMLAMGLKFLQDATVAPEDPGYTWGDITSCAPNNDECVLTMVRGTRTLFGLAHCPSSVPLALCTFPAGTTRTVH